MSDKPKTTFANGVNPFTGEKTKPAIVPVVSDLRISSDPVQTKRIFKPGKYDALFRSMKPGQCVVCEPNQIQGIAQSMRDFMKARGIKGMVRSCSRYETDGKGRVWMLTK